MHRHELDGGDAERVQVREHRLAGDSGVGAAQLLGHVGMHHGHAADVRLVDDGLVGRITRAPLPAPIERGVDHRAEGGERRAVALVEHEVGVRIPHLVAEQLIRPFELPADRLGVRVEQQLVGIEAKPRVRIVRAVHAVAVQLVRSDAGEMKMPRAVGALADANAGLVVAGAVEQAQLHRFGPLREQRKIHTLPVPGGASRKRQSGGLARSFALRCGGRRHGRVYSGVPRSAEICSFMEWTSFGTRNVGVASEPWLSACHPRVCRTSARAAPRSGRLADRRASSRPEPVADFRHVLPVAVDVLTVLDQLVARAVASGRRPRCRVCGRRSMASITRWKRSRSLSTVMSNAVVMVPSSL